MNKIISKSIQIEDLVTDYPFSVEYLSKKGIRCIVCGEPIWGTLEDASKEKGFNDKEILTFVSDLNRLIESFNKVIDSDLNDLDL